MMRVSVRKFRIRVAEQWFEVEAEEIVDQVVVDKAVEPAPPVTISPPKPIVSEDVLAISAPLPGTILDIKVVEGQVVSSGQILMILEAMKMENEIIAHMGGHVRQILVEKGQSVAVGDPLLIVM